MDKPPPPNETAVRPPSSPTFQDLAARLHDTVSAVHEDEKAVKQKLHETGNGLMLNSKRLDTLSRSIAFQNGSLSSSDAMLQRKLVPRIEFAVFSKGAGPPPNGSTMQACMTIKNFSEALNDARKHPHLPLESPVWKTHPCGYCIRAFLYLNGHGDFCGSHVSVFVSVVVGPYDDRLKWPLDALLTFCLLDLETNNSRLHLRTCASDPKSLCFKRPPQESSDTTLFAAGIPDFIPIRDVQREYVKDDTIMLEFKVNHII